MGVKATALQALLRNGGNEQAAGKNTDVVGIAVIDRNGKCVGACSSINHFYAGRIGHIAAVDDLCIVDEIALQRAIFKYPHIEAGVGMLTKSAKCRP